MRKFEKIDKNIFVSDVPDGNYEDITLPKRSTSCSAGYDFYSIVSFTLYPGERKVIPTGVKVMMNDNEFLGIFIRSSLGFKYNVRMCNQVGVIDSDYYNNVDNEGHIFIKLQNHGDNDYVVKTGDKICQGIFINYLVVDNEEKIDRKRLSGIGSTGN